MEENGWTEFYQNLKRASRSFPQVETVFRVILSTLFLFPHLIYPLLDNKQKFLDQLSHKSNYWELQRITEYFRLHINSSLGKYLLHEDWWWYFLVQTDWKRNSIGIKTLTDFHESLGKPEHRKIAGVYFTPSKIIKVTCRYTLFIFLCNRHELMMDKETLYQMVFHFKYPSNLQKEDYLKITHLLTTTKILDPSCGTGVFLIEMVKLIFSLIRANPTTFENSTEDELKIFQDIFSNVYGYDIDSNSVTLAKIILTQQYFQMTKNSMFSEEDFTHFFNNVLQIHERDFIMENDTSLRKFEIIIGNPPYIRHHGLNVTSMKRSRKKFLQELKPFFQGISLKWDKKADLFIYFWLKAITFLKERGVIAFVLSRAWLSSRYAKPLEQVLESLFHLDLILELPLEVWKTAEVRTHIVVGHKDSKEEEQKTMTTIVWKDTVESLIKLEKSVPSIRPLETTVLEADDCQLEIKLCETKRFRITQISDLTPLLMNSKKLFPILRIDYLAMSPFLMNILITKKDRFCMLQDLGKIEMGSTTGANRFFYLDNETVKEYRIPKENLFRMTKSPKEWRTIFSYNQDMLKSFLHIPEKLSEDNPKELREYINSIQEEILRRPYFKNKTVNNWYQVPLIQPDLLIPNMTYKRSFIAYNRDKLHIDKQWIGFWVTNQSWLFPLLAFFNSSLGILLREVQGTKTLGLGSLKLSLKECQNLLVIDPRKIPEKVALDLKAHVLDLGSLEIKPICNNKKSFSEYSNIQESINHLLLVEYLGLTSNDVTRIQEILKFEFYWRFAKEKQNKK